MGFVDKATGGRVDVQSGGTDPRNAGGVFQNYARNSTQGLSKQYSGFDYQKAMKDPVGAYKNWAGGGLGGMFGNVHLPGILGDWQDKAGAGGAGSGGDTGGDAPAPYHVDPGAKPVLLDRNSLYGPNGLSNDIFQKPVNVNFTGGNTQALDAMRAQGLAQGPSPWMNMQLQKQAQDQSNAVNAASMGQAGALANARSNLAAHGGLSGGAAERLARGGARDMNANRQDISNAGMQARTGLGIADEQQKIGLLQNAAQGDLAQAGIQNDMSKYNANAATAANQMNAQNILAENQRTNDFNMQRYGTQMQQYGAANTANAIGAGGADGKGITIICTEYCRQGWIDEEILKGDAEYAYTTPEVRANYLMWAQYVVPLLQKYPILLWVLWPIVYNWSHYAAWKVGKYHKKPLFGPLVEFLGVPLSNCLGRTIKKLKEKKQYAV